MHLLFAFACLFIAWHIPPLIPLSTINNISINLNSSNFTPVVFKAAFHDNHGKDKE